VFVRLFAELVSGEVVSFAVGGSGGLMSVGCQVVEFGGSIVRALGHGFPPVVSPAADCSILNAAGELFYAERNTLGEFSCSKKVESGLEFGGFRETEVALGQGQGKEFLDLGLFAVAGHG
jgi:hypothetical protein